MTVDHKYTYLIQTANAKVTIALLLAVFFISPLLAQQTEIEAKLQGVFIEANKEKLLGNYDKAIPLFEEVLSKDPSNDVAAFELSRVLNEAKRGDEAIKYAKKAVELDPDNIWYTLYLGDLYHSLEMYTDAASVFGGLSEKHPENDDYALKKAFFLVKANQPKEAIEVYESLEKKMGINEEITRRKHSLYLGMGDYKNAAKELIALADAFPQNVKYKHLLATFYKQTGEDQKAEKVYESILELDPNDAEALLAVKGKAQPSGDINDFVEDLKPIFNNPEVGLDVKVKEIIPQIQIVANTGNKDLAMGLLELTQVLEKTHPGEAKVYAIAGDLYFYTNNYEKARDQYAKTLELDESVYLVWEQYLISLEELDDFESLVTQSDNALDIFPNQGMIYYMNGMARRKTGDFSGAILSLNQAKIISGRNPHVLYSVQIELGHAYHALQKFEKSDEAFQKALEMNANDPFLLQGYAEILLERGAMPEKAKEMASLALELQPGNPSMESTLGWVYYQEKDYDKAEEYLRKAFTTREEAVTAERLGDCLVQQNKAEEAITLWKKALQLEPGREGVQEKINTRTLPK
jgi:tetratricopeptide (TPR) repeat protein